jgi:3D (Asp-Asp-Asp) domain-containing protein
VRGVAGDGAPPAAAATDWIDAPLASTTSRPDRSRPAPAPADAPWRNTYYDFPHEGAGARTATVFDAACHPIAQVTKEFHDKVCVQGSGRLAGGATISFAKRGCACAATCPRTDQKICFEKLDPARFPHGRGATGGSITPFRSVAVDPAIVPLGTVLFIPEYQGLRRLDGTPHDGCFVAEDRGMKVVGRHVDVFTGSEEGTMAWNRAVPSNEGVHVLVDAAACRHLARPVAP